MKRKKLEQLRNEGAVTISVKERRRFLKLGLLITGAYLGGKILSLSPLPAARAAEVVPAKGKYPYSPHYAMVIREHRCINCELCVEACNTTNSVPSYGYRTDILERRRAIVEDGYETIFMPVLCNHCNRPPCVRVCPTTATWKDEETGIIKMNPGRCIGCKTCMTACPYNARYFKEEGRFVDKCDFCYEALLSKGVEEPACASACPADVRVFGDLSDTDSRVYGLLHTPETIVWVLRPKTGALPNVYYTNG